MSTQYLILHGSHLRRNYAKIRYQSLRRNLPSLTQRNVPSFSLAPYAAEHSCEKEKVVEEYTVVPVNARSAVWHKIPATRENGKKSQLCK